MGHLRRSARKRLLERVAGILVAVCVVAPGAAAAQTIYRLTDASSFQEGCFAPCMCPVMEQRPVRGTFGLRFTGSDGGFDRYAVEDVHWKVPGRDPELLVNGSGTYTVGNPDATAVRKHRLELDLRLGGAAAEHYDSGWVAGANLPHIQISISLHGMYCYDRVFAVDADPVPASEIEPYALVAGSTFQRGCFDACDCAIGPEQPLAGSFSLLPLSNNSLYAEYGMVDVHWKVQGSGYATPPDAAITGAGSYTVGGEFAVRQRMEAELQIADESPAAFDSGFVVGGGGFPDQIDIGISQPDQVCFETVMHVAASRSQPLPEPAATWQLLAGAGGLLGIARWRGRWRI